MVYIARARQVLVPGTLLITEDKRLQFKNMSIISCGDIIGDDQINDHITEEEVENGEESYELELTLLCGDGKIMSFNLTMQSWRGGSTHNNAQRDLWSNILYLSWRNEHKTAVSTVNLTDIIAHD